MTMILALDEGTTSARAIIFDQEGRVRAVSQKEFGQIYPQPGWVEHDPEEIWSAQIGVAIEAMSRAGVSARELAAIGITNQRETTVVWERDTGRPIANAIVWQDRRTAGICDRLRAEGADEMIRERTGLVIDAYFSGTKIAWLLDNIPNARNLAEAEKLAFGTVDSWLVWKLTDGALHITDVSNASRTMLYDIRRGVWDEDLLRLLRIPRGMMPEVRASSEVYGTASSALGVAGVPLSGMAGDQQAALFGQSCFQPGMTKNTYGTGCFMLECTGTNAARSANKLLTTVGWKLGAGGETAYALEGSVFIAGAVIQWLRDGLRIIRTAEEVSGLASSVEDNGGVYFVPAFAGLGAPHWDPYARGTVVGLSRGTTAGHLARAALESIAFQSADLLDAMLADMRDSNPDAVVPELRVDGGASRSDLLMQFQADLLGVPVVRPANTETTAMGAAQLAGLAVGFWKDLDELGRQYQVERRFEPAGNRATMDELKAAWKNAVERAKGWIDNSKVKAAGMS